MGAMGSGNLLLVPVCSWHAPVTPDPPPTAPLHPRYDMGAAPMQLQRHERGTHVVRLRYGWCHSDESVSCASVRSVYGPVYGTSTLSYTAPRAPQPPCAPGFLRRARASRRLPHGQADEAA